MATVNVHQAKTHLSRLLARVEAGEEVVISRDGRPVAKLTRLATASGRRPLGTAGGRIRYRRPLKAALPKHLRQAFGA